MSDISIKEYVDGQLAASLARTDARFAEVIAELRVLESKIDGKAAYTTVWGAMFTGIISILGVMLAVLAFGGDRFDGGVQLTASSVEYLQDTRVQAEKNANQIDALSQQLDQIIKALDKMPANKAVPSP